jgi:dTDP-4-dehydrorhamnose reductase
MRILVLGRQGQIGWELCRTLAPLGVVVAAGRQDVDLGDAGALRDFVRAARPDLVVNAAAWTAVDAAEDDEAAAYAINGIAPGVIAETLRELGGALIHYSTDYVYDGTKRDAYEETDAPNPQSAYGRTKLAGEDAIRAVAAPHLILRTSWVYGLRGRNFLVTMIRLGAEREVLRVVSDQNGAPTWCRLIAEATAQLIAGSGSAASAGSAARPDVRDLRETYHLTSAGACSWHDFAEAIIRHWHGAAAPRVEAISTAEFGAPAPRPANSRLSCAKLAADFGIALPAWDDALRLVADEAADRA